MDETHDPALRSWVESANAPGCDFPIQNLPLGVFRVGREQSVRIGVAIGDHIFDVGDWLKGPNLNGYFGLSASERRDLRREWSAALRAGAHQVPIFAQLECEMCLPATIGDYTDFYASIHHATNVGKMFRPERPLLPNYRHVPIAYHGRSSSIVVSGTPVRRPYGQLGEGEFGPTRELDYEVELGAFLGPRTELGRSVPVEKAEEHLAGVCLLNDWSARDIQRWEYQPLGPFLAKNFATSISPWIVTLEALEPFRVAAPAHDAPVLPYLRTRMNGAFDITVEAWIRTSRNGEAFQLSSSNFREMHWTFGQMIAHHTSNGCPLREGDLIGSGTISGPDASNRGCLLELTWRGQEQCCLPNGETRCFLEDGDEIILRGFCQREGFQRIGLGSCSGRIEAATVTTTT